MQLSCRISFDTPNTDWSSPADCARTLREIPKERGISQEQLALDSGLDLPYVSLVERGVQSPTVRTLLKLAGVLSVRPSEIVLRMESLLPRGKTAGRSANR